MNEESGSESNLYMDTTLDRLLTKNTTPVAADLQWKKAAFESGLEDVTKL